MGETTVSNSRRASLLVGLGILLSRIAGLVRERVFAHYLGNSDAAGAFKAALRIPNFLQNLFGEGVLSASFIPVYSRLRAQGEIELARKVAGVIGAVLAVVVSFTVLIGVTFTPAFVNILAPGFDDEIKALTIRIVQILFPGVGLLVLSAWCLGILNSHRKFFISYVAPVFWNVAMIGTLIIWGTHSSQNDLVVILAWGSVAGSLLQLGIQLPFVWQNAGRIKFSLRLKEPAARNVLINVGPVMVSRGVVQLSAFIDGTIASYLGTMAVSALSSAQVLYLLPVSLFGMAVAAAELPSMSEDVGATSGEFAEAGRVKLRDRLMAGRKQISFFVIPSAVAFLFLGRALVAALWQTGKFGPEDTILVWYILMGSVVGLLAATWGRLYSSAYYALGDTKTPLRFAIVRIALTTVLGVLFAFPLRPAVIWFFANMPGLGLPHIPHVDVTLGTVGLTASAGLAGWIEFLLLQNGLNKRIGKTPVPLPHLLKVWAAALFSAGLALVVETHGLREMPLTVLGYSLEPVLVIFIFGFTYLVTATGLRLEETAVVLRRLKK
jgi:putative peptidoglycan lipid II flippase